MRGMRRALRIAANTLGVLLLLAALAAAALLINGQRLLNRQVPVQVAAVPYATGAAVLARGEYLFQSRDCAACHGEGGEGKVLIDDPDGFRVRTPNLTPGAGVSRYTEADWVRTIRHGVKPDGRPLFIMPSENYSRLTDDDVAALVAYMRSLPPQEGGPASFELPLLVRLLHGAGQIPDAASKIDHTLPPQQPVPAGDPIQLGRYAAMTCIGCHGSKLEGGRIVGAPPDWPPAANLVSAAGPLAGYRNAEAFATLVHTGVRPDGSSVSPHMPRIPSTSDEELAAMFTFLKASAAP
jgi:mono/diheme cytochrome c family protein